MSDESAEEAERDIQDQKHGESVDLIENHSLRTVSNTDEISRCIFSIAVSHGLMFLQLSTDRCSLRYILTVASHFITNRLQVTVLFKVYKCDFKFGEVISGSTCEYSEITRIDIS